MLKECFGKFGQGECIECPVAEMCSSYFVVQMNGRCPLYGRGFSSANEMCKLCVEYFDGRECKEATLRKRK